MRSALKLSRLDAFGRAQEHLTQKTTTGAVVTLLGVFVMIVLFIHELGFYLESYKVHQMAVDNTSREMKLDIMINISFPGLPCQVLSLDALDMSGQHEVDIHTTIVKERIDKNGNAISREILRDLVEEEHKHALQKTEDPDVAHMFMETQQENDRKSSEIRKALDDQEGCLVYGHLMVQRVAGNFHVSVHGQNFFVLKKVFGSVKEVNVSHHVHTLGFGKAYPGLVNPLDGFHRVLHPESDEAGGTFKYFLKVVPTEYRPLRGPSLSTNQYSVTEYFQPNYKNENNLPAVYFMYDLSPITVTITEKKRNFLHFLTRLCAVLGGTFALSGMLDRWVELLLKEVLAPAKPSFPQ